jgi:hypothetical protein
MRRAELAIVGGLVAALVPAAARADVADAAVGDARDGLPGLGRVGVAEPPPAGWAVGWTGGYGYTEAVLGDDDAHHRAAGTLAGSVRALPALAIGLRLDGRYDKHTGGTADDGWIGDTRITARTGRAVGDRLHVGGQLVLWFPGDTPLVPTADGASAEIAGLLDYAITPSVRLAATLGGRLDRSAGSVPNADRLSDADRMALGVSDSSAVLTGLGVVMRRGTTEIYGDATWDLLVGGDAPSATESPIRVGAGARVRIADGWTARGGVEVSLSSRPPLGAMDPLVPIDPRLAISVGVTWRLGGARPAPRAEIRAVTGDDPPPPDEGGTVRGRLLAPDGTPLAGARVSAGETSTETDSDGRFELRGLPRGAVTLVVEPVPPFAGITRTVEVGDKPAVVGDVSVERELPPGQIRGVVRTTTGAAVAARVRIEPLGKSIKAGADGSFRVDVPPGSYQVVIDGPGLVAQRRKIQVEENGVTVLNVELRAER